MALGFGVVVCLLTVNAPIYQGPVSTALGGANLSWVLGFAVSALVYLLISRQSVQREVDNMPPAPDEAPEQFDESLRQGLIEREVSGSRSGQQVPHTGSNAVERD